MPIVITRTGDLNPKIPQITQEQRDALWAAFVTSWVEKHKDECSQLLSQPEPEST